MNSFEIGVYLLIGVAILWGVMCIVIKLVGSGIKRYFEDEQYKTESRMRLHKHVIDECNKTLLWR